MQSALHTKMSVLQILILSPSGYLFEEEYVNRIHLWEICLALLSEKVVNISLRLDLLHKLMDVYLL